MNNLITTITPDKTEQLTQVSVNSQMDFKSIFENQQITFDISELSLKDIIKHDNLLKINGVDVIIRKEDGYFNLTKMCQAGRKEFRHWNENKSNQAFLTALSLSRGIPRDKLIKKEKVFSTRELIYWGHPQIAINIAQWLSPEIDVQVTKWIFQLLLTGSVILGKELNNKQLDEIYKEKISLECKLLKQNQDIEDILKDNRLKMSQNIAENFNMKKIFYIGFIGIINGRATFKFGFTKNIKRRIRRHKTDYGYFELLYCIECDDNDTLEQDFKNNKYIISRRFTHDFVVNDKTMKKTELIYLDDEFTIEDIKKLLKKLKHELDLTNKVKFEQERTRQSIEKTKQIKFQEKTKQLQLQLQILQLQNGSKSVKDIEYQEIKNEDSENSDVDSDVDSEDELENDVKDEKDINKKSRKYDSDNGDDDSDSEADNDDDLDEIEDVQQIEYEVMPLKLFFRKELNKICALLNVPYTITENNPKLIEKLTAHKIELNDNPKFYKALLDVYHKRGKPTKNELTNRILLRDKTDEDIEYIKTHLDIFIVAELREICFALGSKTADKKHRDQLIEIIIELCMTYNPEVVELKQYEKTDLQNIGKDLGVPTVWRNKDGGKLNKKTLIEYILLYKNNVTDQRYRHILEKYKNNFKSNLLALIYKNNRTQNDIKYICENIHTFKFEELQNIGRILGSQNVSKDTQGIKLNKDELEDIIKKIVSK